MRQGERCCLDGFCGSANWRRVFVPSNPWNTCGGYSVGDGNVVEKMGKVEEISKQLNVGSFTEEKSHLSASQF